MQRTHGHLQLEMSVSLYHQFQRAVNTEATTVHCLGY